MPTVAEYLGTYAATLRYEDLPAEVVHQAKRLMLDTVGCAFGGYESEPARIARDLAAEVSCTRPATVLCSNQKTTPELAVFANDVMMRYLDFNDGYIASGSGHPSDSIAALLRQARWRVPAGVS
jgi:2-methylcitrate dehydratase